MKPSVRELIPPLLIFVLGVCAVALVLEFLVAGFAGKAADSTAVTALSGIITACIPALVLLYRLDTTPPPPQPPQEDSDPAVSSTELEGWREEIKRYLDELFEGWWLRWRSRLL